MSRDLIETGLGWSWGPERVRRNIVDADTAAIVSARLARIRGFALMHFGDDEAHLNLLAVRPDCQRRGIGRSLMAWLLQSARCAGLAAVRTELRANNVAARRFYEGLGFSVEAFVPGYYRGREAALRMVKVLRCPALETVRWEPPAAWKRTQE